MSERINKGCAIINKEEKNILKILSYISKVNQNKKNME